MTQIMAPRLAMVDGQLAVVVATCLVVCWLVATRTTCRSTDTKQLPQAPRLIWLGLVLLLVTVTAALRLSLGPGPADVVEATRWSGLFEALPASQPQFASAILLVDLLLSAGVSSATLYTWFGPLTSAFAVGATVWLGRLVGLRPAVALGSGLLLALWPHHIVHGAAASLTIWASFLVLGQGISALAPVPNPVWRVLGLLGWTTLAYLARPEFRMAPLFALVWAFGWPRRQQLALLLGTIALVGLLPHGDSLHRLKAPEVLGVGHLAWLLWRLEGAPVWLIWAGLAGLGLLRPWERKIQLLLPVMALFVVYHLNQDGNGVVGPWRYFLAFLPLVCLGVGQLMQQLAKRPWQLVAMTSAAVFSVVVYAPLWLYPTDFRAEFQTLTRTASAATQGVDVLLLDDHDGEPTMGIEHAQRSLLALHLATGERWYAAKKRSVNGLLGHLGNTPVYSVAAWLRSNQRPSGTTAAWLGLATPDHTRQALLTALSAAPTNWTTTTVWPCSGEDKGWCPSHQVEGIWTQKCALVLGWVRNTPLPTQLR